MEEEEEEEEGAAAEEEEEEGERGGGTVVVVVVVAALVPMVGPVLPVLLASLSEAILLRGCEGQVNGSRMRRKRSVEPRP